MQGRLGIRRLWPACPLVDSTGGDGGKNLEPRELLVFDERGRREGRRTNQTKTGAKLLRINLKEFVRNSRGINAMCMLYWKRFSLTWHA